MDNKIMTLLKGPVLAINIGLPIFASSLEEQNVEVVHVDWYPPAGGDKEMADLLDELI